MMANRPSAADMLMVGHRRFITAAAVAPSRAIDGVLFRRAILTARRLFVLE